MRNTMGFLVGVLLLSAIAFGMGQASQNVNVVQPVYQSIISVYSATQTYVGESLPGTATDASAWRVKGIFVSGGDTTVKYLNGSGEFNQKWTNALSNNY